MNSHFVYQQEAASNLWAKQCYIAAEISQPSGEQGYHASHESNVTEPHPMECQDLVLTSQEGNIIRTVMPACFEYPLPTKDFHLWRTVNQAEL